MLSRLRNMFRVPDLRNKILFTLVIVGLYRVGAHLPVPFIDFNAIKDLQRQSQNTGLVGFPGFQGRDLIPGFNTPRAALIVLTWTAGTALLMWLAELITQRGIGNGMSILIFASVVSRLPAQGSSIYSEGSKFQFFTIIGIGIAMIVGIVFVESGQRRIPVQFAKRVVGRRMYGGQSTYIPLKVNQSGVIPVIFASSILSFPALIASMLGNSTEGWRKQLTQFINKWVVNQTNPVHLIIYGAMIVGFAYFYNAIAFDPAKQADQL